MNIVENPFYIELALLVLLVIGLTRLALKGKVR